MNDMIVGTPSNDGDTYEVIMCDGTIAFIHFCPQQGWIDKDWNKFDESKIVKYKWIGDKE